MLIYHEWGPLAFSWEQFHRNCSRLSLATKCLKVMYLEILWYLPGLNELMLMGIYLHCIPLRHQSFQGYEPSDIHDDVIKWKHFPRNWPFVRGIHRSPVNSPHKGQWRGALMFSLICVWINVWVNNHEAGDLRRHRGHYIVSVMIGCD